MQDHGGGQRGGGIHQTVALEPGGVEIAGPLVGDGPGCGHEERVHQILQLRTGEVGIPHGQLLADQRGGARQEGGRHGGAAHAAVATQGFGQRRVDVAAGGSDLRLQLQVGSDTHGGELGDLACGGIVHGLVRSKNGDMLVRKLHQIVAVGLGNKNRGNGRALDTHVAEHTVNIVADDDGGGTGSLTVQDLFREGQLAAPDQRDPAPEIPCGGVIGGGAHALHNHIGVVAGDGLDIHLGGGVGDVPLSCQNGGQGGDQIVGTGHRQGGAEAGGGADHAGVRVGGQAHVGAGVVAQGGVILVSGGADQADTRLPDPPVGLVDDPVPAVGEAAVGAEGHVDHIRAQLHCILQSRQGDGVGGARAGVGEGLQNQKLCIGSHAGEADLTLGILGVTGGNARHMGAVADIVGIGGGVGVHIGVPVRVVKGEGDLFAHIGILGCQTGKLCFTGQVPAFHGGGNIRNAQGSTGRGVGEGLVVGVQARIDNRDGDARAGVAQVPSGEHMAQVQSVVHGGLHQLIDPGDEGILHPRQTPDGLQLAVGDTDGEAVEDGGILPLKLRLAAGQPVDAQEHRALVVQKPLLGLCHLFRLHLDLSGGEDGEKRLFFKLHDHVHDLIRGVGFRRNKAAVQLLPLPGELQGVGNGPHGPGSIRPDGGGQQSRCQRQDQQQTAQTQKVLFFHLFSSFSPPPSPGGWSIYCIIGNFGKQPVLLYAVHFGIMWYCSHKADKKQKGAIT